MANFLNRLIVPIRNSLFGIELHRRPWRARRFCPRVEALEARTLPSSMFSEGREFWTYELTKPLTETCLLCPEVVANTVSTEIRKYAFDVSQKFPEKHQQFTPVFFIGLRPYGPKVADHSTAPQWYGTVPYVLAFTVGMAVVLQRNSLRPRDETDDNENMKSQGRPSVNGESPNAEPSEWANLEIGTAIRQLRSLRGITQKQLAEEAGVTINFLSLVENGRVGVSMKVLDRFAEILRVPTSWIMFLASAREPLSKRIGRIVRHLQNDIRKFISAGLHTKQSVISR